MILNKIKPRAFSLLLLKNLYSSCESPRLAMDPFQISKLLSSYFKFGRAEDAKKLFEETPEKNVVFWSIMIHGYGTNGLYKESLKLFSQMRVSGLVPNSFTIVGVLVTSSGLQDSVLGQSVHGLIVKTGLESDLIVGTAMLDTYAKCGNIFDSRKLFERIKNPGLIPCNAIIAGFIGNKLFEEGLVLFNQLRQSGLVPNYVTILTVIQSCVALHSRSLCESIHSSVVKTGLGSNLSVINSVLYMYSSLRDLDAATKIFNKMISKDFISWTTMIGLFVRLEYAFDALDLFCEMRDNGVNLDTVVMVNLITACSLLGDLKRGRLIHAQAVICGFGSELPLANSIIAMYSKCGDLNSSRIVFDQTADKSLVSWTAMISGYVQYGRPGEAMYVLIRMRVEEDFGLDSIMLVSALTACGELAVLELCQQLHCYVFNGGFSQYTPVQNSLVSTYSKCGDLELAHNVFKEISYRRDIVSWNAIIYGYGINGHGRAAVTLFQEMEKNGEDPDSATYLCVLSACSHSGLVDDGLMIFNRMLEENRIRPSREHCGCVVDMLARAGCLVDASKFVSKFSEGFGPNIWRALLGGCQIHSNVGLAEFAANRVFELDPEEPGQVVLLSNVYASVGRFEEAEALRLGMKRKGLIKNPGFSFLNGMPWDYG